MSSEPHPPPLRHLPEPEETSEPESLSHQEAEHCIQQAKESKKDPRKDNREDLEKYSKKGLKKESLRSNKDVKGGKSIKDKVEDGADMEEIRRQEKRYLRKEEIREFNSRETELQEKALERLKKERENASSKDEKSRVRVDNEIDEKKRKEGTFNRKRAALESKKTLRGKTLLILSDYRGSICR
jgi:hypothetical protein